MAAHEKGRDVESDWYSFTGCCSRGTGHSVSGAGGVLLKEKNNLNGVFGGMRNRGVEGERGFLCGGSVGDDVMMRKGDAVVIVVYDDAGEARWEEQSVLCFLAWCSNMLSRKDFMLCFFLAFF